MVKRNNQILPIGILAGGIIGAGVFSLPFLFHAAGLTVGFFYLVCAAVVYSALHLMYADIVLRTPGNHRFVGYLEYYLGRKFFGIGVVMAVVEMLFTLTIYLILSQSFTHLLIPEGSAFAQVLIFWIFSSAAIFMSLRRLALSETVVTGFMVAIILAIFIFGVRNLPQVLATPLPGSMALGFLLPLPAILFALSGRVAIPSLIGYFKRKRANVPAKAIKQAVVFGTILPAIAYAAFVIGTLGLSPRVSPDAVSGLIGFVPPILLISIGVLGWLSLWSSYILVGLDVEKTLRFDMKMGQVISALLVVILPMALYVLGLRDFIQLISYVGGLLLALEGICIIAMWQRANRRGSAPILFAHKKQTVLIAGMLAIFILAFLSMILTA